MCFNRIVSQIGRLRRIEIRNTQNDGILLKGFPFSPIDHDGVKGDAMKIGYLRVSTVDQNHQRQIDSLKTVCDELYTETISAINKKRPVFERVIGKLHAGDTLVVHDLDRAFRSTLDALKQAEQLRKRGVEFQILSLNVDTGTPAGQLVFTVMAAFAQYERQCLSQRTKEGMAAAKRRGKHVGRPKKIKKL